MSIASEIERLQDAKADIKTAIEAKGVTIPSSATLDDYGTYIEHIPSGGGGDVSNYFNTTIEVPAGFANKIIKKFPKLTIVDGKISLGNAFSNTSFANMSFEGIDCSNIKYMTNMFASNNSLQTIDLANITNTLSVVSVQKLFQNNSSMTTLLNMFPLTGSMNCQNAFEKCNSLTKLDLSNWNITLTSSNVAYMFNETKALAILDVSNITFPSSLSGTYAFTSCGTNCLQSDGAYADGIPYIYVKNTGEQTKVIATHNNWSTDNVIVKSN